jgi:hypothetical protein
MYPESEWSTRDIDWFVKIGDIYIHGASNGGVLPSMITKGQNRQIQQAVAKMDYLYADSENDIFINSDYVNQRLKGQKGLLETDGDNFSPYNAYITSFKNMARKGFYSFDRVIASTLEEDSQESNQIQYVLIACPRQLRANKLPNIENVPEIEYNAKLFEDCLVNRKELSISLNAVNKMWRLTCIERRLLRKKGNDNPSFL